jgi:hypothetical protein
MQNHAQQNRLQTHAPRIRRRLPLALGILGALALGCVPAVSHAAALAPAPTTDVLTSITGWVDALKPYARLAAIAGLSGYAMGYFLIPWFPAWAQQHRDWVRGAGLVLVLLFFGPSVIESVLSSQ